MNSQLQVLADQCSNCRDCPYGEAAVQSVFAKGNPESALVFVGGAPGESEDREGIPFVGEAGKLFDKMLARMREECKRLRILLPDPYVCNVLKHRPPDNRLLKSGEDIKACAPKLFEQINLMPNVRVIVALGRVAAQTLLGTSCPIGQLRGQSYRNTRMGDRLVWAPSILSDSSSEWRDPNRRITVVPTWHPSYLLHQPNWMQPRHQCWSDLQIVLELLREADDEIPF